MVTRPVVAAARNNSHSVLSVGRAIQHVLENSSPSLSSIVKRGHRALVKVNMGCSGRRLPETRLTTHPLVAEAIINVLQDFGATVSFGDDVARAGKYTEGLYEATGMRDVARRTGAKLIDFVSAGAREVRGGLLHPRTYLITNAWFDADVVINAASCRSHVGIGLSGAMKNMFGCVVGRRKQLIHDQFAGHPELFGRAIADIYRTVQPDFSFLDLTSVAEAAGITLAVRRVGLILGSTDAVALDTVAAHAIGYEDLPIWPSHYGQTFGLGCNLMSGIEIRGVDWSRFEKSALQPPLVGPVMKTSVYDRITTVLNSTILRPRPVIDPGKCTGCGDCSQRCPVGCIEDMPGSMYRIDSRRCADCGCCVNTCEVGAVNLKFIGLARAVRVLSNRLPEDVDPQLRKARDPAPML